MHTNQTREKNSSQADTGTGSQDIYCQILFRHNTFICYFKILNFTGGNTDSNLLKTTKVYVCTHTHTIKFKLQDRYWAGCYRTQGRGMWISWGDEGEALHVS